jgi:NADP-dependent 3-hydroxy acid dehydrogenase YdfG
MKALAGQVFCVTGAGRGLGAAIARALNQAGASLVLGARSTHEIDALAGQLKDAIAVQTDVRSAEDVERLVEAAVAEYGQLDGMINNAGVAVYGPLESASTDEIHLMVDTNLKGVIFGSQAALKVMKPRRSGLIINIASIAGTLHLPNESIYGATKWAVRGFTGVLRLEAAASNIRVSCVCPGGIDTPFWKTQEFLPFPEHLDPEQDFLKAEEVAQLVLSLALAPSALTVPEIVLAPLIAP